MNKRTDIHRPSVINGEDYEFVVVEPMMKPGTLWIDEFHDVDYVVLARQIKEDHMADTGGQMASHNHGGSCHICGAWANDLVLWYHKKSNEYILSGETCAENMEGFSLADFQRCKEASRLARESARDEYYYKAGKKRAYAILEDRDMLDALESGDDIVRDMIRRLIRNGALSDKQWNFMGSLIGSEEDRMKQQAKWAEEKAAALPVPEFDGRTTVEMTVLKTKGPEEDDMYPTWKMILKHDDGWMLMGSIPSSIDPQRGDRVRLDARIKISDRDPKFGFFSRPTKAINITEDEKEDSSAVETVEA